MSDIDSDSEPAPPVPAPAAAASTAATAPPSASHGEHPRESSMTIFRRFINKKVLPDGAVVIDAAGILSKECYAEWLVLHSNGGKTLADPERIFQRHISGCVGGTDGRRPFEADEEAAVLHVLRIKKIWPAFEGSSVTIGSQGYRSYGYWEKKRIADDFGGSGDGAEILGRSSADADSGARKKRKTKKKPAKNTEGTFLVHPVSAEGSVENDVRSMDVTSRSITPLPSPPGSPS